MIFNACVINSLSSSKQILQKLLATSMDSKNQFQKPCLIVKSKAIIHNFSKVPISETAGIKFNSIMYNVVFVLHLNPDKIFCQVMRVFFQIKFFFGVFQRTFLYFYNKATIKLVFAISFLQIEPIFIETT